MVLREDVRVLEEMFVDYPILCTQGRDVPRTYPKTHDKRALSDGPRAVDIAKRTILFAAPRNSRVTC